LIRITFSPVSDAEENQKIFCKPLLASSLNFNISFGFLAYNFRRWHSSTENELPEKLDYSRVNLITFSQEEGEGLRYGFLKTHQV